MPASAHAARIALSASTYSGSVAWPRLWYAVSPTPAIATLPRMLRSMSAPSVRRRGRHALGQNLARHHHRAPREAPAPALPHQVVVVAADGRDRDPVPGAGERGQVGPGARAVGAEQIDHRREAHVLAGELGLHAADRGHDLGPPSQGLAPDLEGRVGREELAPLLEAPGVEQLRVDRDQPPDRLVRVGLAHRRAAYTTRGSLRGEQGRRCKGGQGPARAASRRRAKLQARRSEWVRRTSSSPTGWRSSPAAVRASARASRWASRASARTW